jgi:PAS domain S-box-containing protein
MRDPETNVQFLQGGGEMGKLSRGLNWSETPAGDPSQWHPAIAAAASIVLGSKHPMLLFMGDDMVQIYNDAIMPSLEKSGIHPSALGQKAQDCWSDIWHILEPMLSSVKETGEAVRREHLKLPVVRYGKEESAWWTISYNPVRDEKGRITGILAICEETTEYVQEVSELKGSSERFREMVMQAPVAIAVYRGSDLVAEIVNEAYLPLVGKTREQFEGKPLFESLPEVRKEVEGPMNRVMSTGEAFHANEFEVFIDRNGRMEQCFFNLVFEPFRENGKIVGVMAVAHEVTGLVTARHETEESALKLRSLIAAAPEAIAVYVGRDLIIDMKNEPYMKMIGKGRDIGGKPLSEVMPELASENQPFLKLLDDVYTSGKQFSASEMPAKITQNGVLEDNYYDFSYTPLRNAEGEIYAILHMALDVTDRVAQRLKIEESERRFRTMAEASEVFISVGDETGAGTYFNQAWIETTGRNLEQLLDYGWADLVHPEDKEPWLDNYHRAFVRQQPFHGEFRLRDHRGNYQWLYAQGAPRFRDDGTLAGYISSCINITERKSAEQQLRRSEEQVRAMISSAPFPIGVYIGKEMRIAFANRKIMDVWGKGDGVVGKTYSEVLPELAEQNIYQQLDRVFSTGEPFHAQNQRVDLVVDGLLQPFYFNYSFTPLFNDSGEVYGVMNTAAEVTDLIVTQHKLQLSEQNLHNMILQAPVAMCILLGPEHRVEVANDMMIELWGKPKEAMMDRPIFEGLPDAREQGLELLLDGVFNTGETFRASERPVELLRNGKYEQVYQNFVYEPYRGGDGEILGVLAVTIDVTAEVSARKEIEDIVQARTAELADANRELQRSNAELEQFAYIASHDLQEPLRKISIFLQMLEAGLGEMDERSKGYMEKIYASAARMTRLIRDVLSYSRLAKESFAFEPVDMNVVVTEILQDFDLLIQQKSAVFEVSGLPVVSAIHLQMSQLMSNLVANALKFSKPDVKPKVMITSEELTQDQIAGYGMLSKERKYAMIVVRDNGIGFGQEYAEKIFNIFQRLHDKAAFEGTGIGLSMCQKIADNHAGHIFATSEEGHGAAFHVILPLA